MSNDKNRNEIESNETVEPFNNAIEHYQTIMGMPNKKADLNAMPKAVRYFYYFVVVFLLICFSFMIYIYIFK